MGVQFDNEVATVVFCTFIFVAVICVMWWIVAMEGARYRQKNKAAIKDAAVEYEREKTEKTMRIKKKKRLEHIREKTKKKRRKKNDE